MRRGSLRNSGPLAPGPLLHKLPLRMFTHGLRMVYAWFTQIYAEFTHGLRTWVAVPKLNV